MVDDPMLKYCSEKLTFSSKLVCLLFVECDYPGPKLLPVHSRVHFP